jgi:hypothetical protein
MWTSPDDTAARWVYLVHMGSVKRIRGQAPRPLVATQHDKWRWCPSCGESWRTELLPGVTTDTCPQCDAVLVPWRRFLRERSVA